jgi:hypothetical protein
MKETPRRRRTVTSSLNEIPVVKHITLLGGLGVHSEAVRHERRRYDMNGRFQMQGSKNWILPKEINANRFFWDSHWLEIWSNHFCPSMGLNGGSVAMDSGDFKCREVK